MSHNAKKAFCGLSTSRKKTGGGPPDKDLDPTTAKIVSILGDEPSFSGIVGGFETTTTGKTTLFPHIYKNLLILVLNPYKRLLEDYKIPEKEADIF